MAHSISRKPEVRRDLVEQADYISRDNLDAALRFLDAAESTFKFLPPTAKLGSPAIFRHPRPSAFASGRSKAFAIISCSIALRMRGSRFGGCCTAHATSNRYLAERTEGRIMKAATAPRRGYVTDTGFLTHLRPPHFRYNRGASSCAEKVPSHPPPARPCSRHPACLPRALRTFGPA
jgi:plasmid stabilization system protein ParE